VQILLVDWKAFDPLELGMALAVVLRAQYRAEWQPEGLLRLLADRATYQAILDRKPVAEIKAMWGPELAEYRQVRAKYLLYR
jgi:uncharacterized protein YbbC (DUF1343 family)